MSAAWTKALGFAALPGAALVRFEKRHVTEQDGALRTQFSLQSFSETGQTLGDDRDYDLLKAVIGPLEKLAPNTDHEDFMIELDTRTGQLNQTGK